MTPEAAWAQASLCKLGDAQLHARARALVGDERRLVLGLLFHLEEIDRRRSYDGCRSLWDYCLMRLQLPESQIFLRTKAVQLIRHYPDAIPRLRDGRLNLSTLVALRKALTPDNATTLFDAVEGKTKKEAVAIAAMAKARVVPRSFVRPVPPAIVPVPEAIARMRREEAGRAWGACSGGPGGSELGASEGMPSPVASGPFERVPVVPTSGDSEEADAWLVFGGEEVRDLRPVSATQCQITFTAPIGFQQELEELRDGLSHVVPDGDLASLVQYAVREVLVRLRKKNGTIAVRERKPAGRSMPADVGPRSAPPPPARATVTACPGSDRARPAGATVATAGAEMDPRVSERATIGAPGPGDLARPELDPPRGPRRETPSGDHAGARRSRSRRDPVPASLRRLVLQRDQCRCSICGSTWQVEIDHVVPVACGGKTTLSNLRSVCKRHNLQAEREAFGDAFVDGKIRASRTRTKIPVSSRDPPEKR